MSTKSITLILISSCVLFGLSYCFWNDSKESARQDSIESIKQLQQGMMIIPEENSASIE